jgi:glycerol uptake facilitator protein
MQRDFLVPTTPSPADINNSINSNYSSINVRSNTTDHSLEVPSTLSQSNKYKLFASEYAGMVAFITLSLSNVAIFGLMPSKMSWEGVAISWGFNLLFGIKIASYGNGYLNPCIAFCDYVLGKNINLCEFSIYVLAEVLGAFTGAAITYGIHRNLYLDNNALVQDNTAVCGYFATYSYDGVNKLQAFAVEFLGTMMFAMAIFKILKTKTPHAAYAISMSLTAVTLALGFQTAFSYNWARDFGPRLFITMVEPDCFSKKDNYWFIPLLANFSGAVVGWFVAQV